MHNENPSDIRSLSDAEQEQMREQDREFGRQIMADREKYAQQERDQLAKEKAARFEKRRADYTKFRGTLVGFSVSLHNLLLSASRWDDSMKFMDCDELNEVRTLLKRLEKLTTPVSDTFSDRLPIYLPVRADRAIPAGYHDDPETGKWKLDGY